MTKTILMIHGFGAAGDSWKPVAASFEAAGYAVEAPTIHAALRTVGPPPAGLAGKTLADYVAEMSDLAKAIAKRDGAAPVVFGHSMGGLIAQKLAEAGLTSGLVLFAPASPADARGKPKLSPVFTFLNIALASKPETKAVKIWKTGFKWGVLNQTPAARHDAIFATTVHDSGRALSDLAYPDRDPNRTVHVDAAKVTVPVLILAGARDRTTPIEDLRLVGKKYAGAEFREYPDNAHWLVDEPGSPEILAGVKTWLDAKGLGAPAPAAKAAPAAPAPAKAEAAKPAVPVTPVAAPAAAKAASKPAAKAKAAPKPKAAAVKAAPTPAPAPTAKAPAKAKTPAKAAPAPTAKAAAPAPKAPAIAKPVAKPAAKAAPAPKAKAPAKAAPKVATTPKVAKAVPAPAPVETPKAVAKPKPVAKPAAAPAPAPVKAPAKTTAPKAATKPKAASAAKAAPAAKAPAKPAAAKAPAPAKTPVKPAAKASATKSTAKSSPAPKKSV